MDLQSADGESVEAGDLIDPELVELDALPRGQEAEPLIVDTLDLELITLPIKFVEIKAVITNQDRTLPPFEIYFDTSLNLDQDSSTNNFTGSNAR
ncbi:MAG: hypothetical protein R3B41_00180 [Candidatus Doudnabacteria bacterium]